VFALQLRRYAVQFLAFALPLSVYALPLDVLALHLPQYVRQFLRCGLRLFRHAMEVLQCVLQCRGAFARAGR
jgi:hypothetical protein